MSRLPMGFWFGKYARAIASLMIVTRGADVNVFAAELTALEQGNPHHSEIFGRWRDVICSAGLR